MLALDVLLYGALAWYLDKVVPAAHGQHRSPTFIFSPEFWAGRQVGVASPRSSAHSRGHTARGTQPAAGAVVVVRGLRKVYAPPGGGPGKVGSTRGGGGQAR